MDWDNAMSSPVYAGFWNLNDFPRLGTESDDTNRIQRAVNAALSLQVPSFYIGTGSVSGATGTAQIQRTVYLPGISGSYLIAQSVTGGSTSILLDGSNATGTGLPAHPSVDGTLIVISGTPASSGTVTLASNPVPNAGGVNVTVPFTTSDTDTTIAARIALSINEFASGVFAFAVASGGNVTVYTPSYPYCTWTAVVSISSVTAALAQYVGLYVGTVPTAIIQIVGDGVGETNLQAGGNGITVFSAPNSANGIIGQTLFEIREMSFTKSSIGYQNVTGISLSGQVAGPTQIGRIFLSELSFEYLAGGTACTAIVIACAQGTFIDDIEISHADIGIFIDDAGDTAISNVLVANGQGPGIQIIGNSSNPADHIGEGVFLNNVQTNGQALGLLIEDQTWGTATGCSFTTCTIGGMIISQHSGGTTQGWSFSSCQFTATNVISWPTSLTTGSPSGAPVLYLETTNGLTVGMAPIGFGIPSGAVIVSISSSANTVTLSQNLTGTLSAGTQIVIPLSSLISAPTTAASTTTTLTFASTAGLFLGMGVSDTTTPSAIGAYTFIVGITSTTVTLSSVPIGSGVLSGDLITFTVPTSVQLTTTAASSGTTIGFASTTNYGLFVGMLVIGANIPSGTYITAITSTIVTISQTTVPFVISLGSVITFLRTPLVQIATSAASSSGSTTLSFSSANVGGVYVGMNVYATGVPSYAIISSIAISGGTATVTLSQALSAAISSGSVISFAPSSAITIGKLGTNIQFAGCFVTDAPIGMTINLLATSGGGYHNISGCNFSGLPFGAIYVQGTTGCTISGTTISESGFGVTIVDGGYHAVSGCAITSILAGACISALGTVSCAFSSNVCAIAQRGILMNGTGFTTISGCSCYGNSNEDIYIPSTNSSNISGTNCLSSVGRTGTVASIRDDVNTAKPVIGGVVVATTISLTGTGGVTYGLQSYP